MISVAGDVCAAGEAFDAGVAVVISFTAVSTTSATTFDSARFAFNHAATFSGVAAGAAERRLNLLRRLDVGDALGDERRLRRERLVEIERLGGGGFLLIGGDRLVLLFLLFVLVVFDRLGGGGAGGAAASAASSAAACSALATISAAPSITSSTVTFTAWKASSSTVTFTAAWFTSSSATMRETALSLA